MTFLNTLSVRNKVVLLTSAIAFFTLALGFLLIAFYDVKAVKKDFAALALKNAQLIGDFSFASASIQKKSELEKTIEQTGSHFDIESIYVFDVNGNLIASLPTGTYVSTPFGWRSASVEFLEDSLNVIEPIERQKQFLGSIYLSKSTDEMHRKIFRHKLDLLMFFAVAVIGAILLSFRLQHLISGPILKLAESTAHIPESVVFSPEEQPRAADEIGMLYSGFEKMRRKIDRREAQRNRAEAALDESEKRYRNLVESNPDAIFVQQDNRVVYMNSSGLKMLAVNALTEVLEGKRKEFFQTLRKQEGQGPQYFEAPLTRSDSKLIDVEVILIDTMHEGSPALLGILRDVTERKQLRETTERMKQLAAVGELSAQVAHEIRNSIGSLQLNLRYFMEHNDIPESREKGTAGMQSAIERLEQSVTSILKFARPNPPALQKVSVKLVLESSLKAEQRELKEQGIQIIRNYDNSLPEIEIDPNQIQQVFLNLIRNSRQAMPSGGTLTVTTKAMNGFIDVEITDTGMGIPNENRENIFRPFFTTKSDGTGLGLAIVARTLELHRAEIFIEGSPPLGATFHVRFPLSVSI